MEVTLGNKPYQVERAKLKRWLALEEIRDKFFEAVEIADTDGMSNSICLYISTALDIPVEVIETLLWLEVSTAYAELTMLNSPSKSLPFMKFKSKSTEKAMWDYEGRTWFAYSHMIAQCYGWSLSDISELDVDDALALIQEILVDEQLNKEWQWVLSDKSVGYNTNTKKSEFHPLDRPGWMMPIPKPPKMVKIPIGMMPVGVGVRWKDTSNVVH